jgi:hypothetical protein
MPTPQEILLGLSLIAREAWLIALGWHVVIAIALAALALGWRPRKRLAAALLALPLASASAMTWTYGNPFNGALLAGAAAAIAVLATRLPSEPVVAGRTHWRVAGGLMVAFGWVYAHFLPEQLAYAFLYAAPTGLVPCPTLATVTGFALMAGGFHSRAWSWTLAAFGLFYGLFGVLRLGVVLDVGLIAGAGSLAACPLARKSVAPAGKHSLAH